MIVGGCLSGCGLVAASFCNSVKELYLCIGVIGGELLLVHFQALTYCWPFGVPLQLSFRSLVKFFPYRNYLIIILKSCKYIKGITNSFLKSYYDTVGVHC